MRSKLLIISGVALSLGLLVSGGLYYQKNLQNNLIETHSAPPQEAINPAQSLSPSSNLSLSPPPTTTPTPSPSSSVASLDLTVDAHGLSKTTAVMNTSKGVVRFKFYPNEAPKTVHRFIELIQQGFYNHLKFHRVEPNFVVQGGDPLGNGTGGSGKKLEPEFNERHHIEGTLAMARTSDVNSADSQFYISLGTYPQLDHQYTVFGQVISGIDIVSKIRVGDEIVSISLE